MKLKKVLNLWLVHYFLRLIYLMKMYFILLRV
nr:MAG TPA: hypothetical protein [Caudoviricetes sp.]